MCPASGKGNPHLRHIHEKKKIKKKDSTGRENRTERNRTEQKVSIQARKICLLSPKLHRFIICLYKHIR